MPDLSSLQFLWSLMLYACAGVPLFAVYYSYRTRSIPPLLLCLGLLLLCAALARPQTILMTPLREATVMLVLDTSGSMRAKDLKPSRIEAAQQAAKQFIQDKPSSLRVGLVTAAGTAAKRRNYAICRAAQRRHAFMLSSSGLPCTHSPTRHPPHPSPQNQPCHRPCDGRCRR